MKSLALHVALRITAARCTGHSTGGVMLKPASNPVQGALLLSTPAVRAGPDARVIIVSEALWLHRLVRVLGRLQADSGRVAEDIGDAYLGSFP